MGTDCRISLHCVPCANRFDAPTLTRCTMQLASTRDALLSLTLHQTSLLQATRINSCL